MTLKRKLAFRYGIVCAICLLLLAGLAYHEFVAEPAWRKALGISELPETFWGENAEVFFYGLIPVILGFGWRLMHKTLVPINTFAQGVERIQAHNLSDPLPRSGNGDEVDRLTEVFNSMTERLDRSFQQIREFTLHASHELKTPLTIMRAQLETGLREKNQTDQGRIEGTEALLCEIDRLARIVDSLTLLTKMDAGLMEMNFESLSLSELIQESAADAQTLGELSGICVNLAHCESLSILGDRQRLRQVMLNLIDNAVKYNRQDGSIEISLKKSSPYAEIRISNTGSGIPKGMEARVFDRFFRCPMAKETEGCGLGLALCKSIVLAHRGSIEISTDANQLTTVLVRLPLAR